MTSAAEGADDAGQGAPAAAASNPWANPRRLHAALADDSRARAARTVPPDGATPPARIASLEVKAAPPTPPSGAWDVAQLQAAPFERRGFVNSGNLCFANATLQALLGLEPFVALLRHLEHMQLPPEPPTPTLRALAALAREFPPEEYRAHGRVVSRPRSGSSAVCIDDFFSSFLATFDASLGAAVASSARGARQAARRVRQQQDAHEFLSSLLDHAHVVSTALELRFERALTQALSAGAGAAGACWPRRRGATVGCGGGLFWVGVRGQAAEHQLRRTHAPGCLNTIDRHFRCAHCGASRILARRLHGRLSLRARLRRRRAGERGETQRRQAERHARAIQDA